jgi:predicted acyltransferase
MYHRQFPPPGDVAVNVAGISWRDLTYVSFLFTMATALPLVLTRRIDRGEPELAIFFAAARRYFMLMVFGLLMAHSDTYFLGYTQPARVLSIVGFCVLALVFTRRRKSWDPVVFGRLRTAGWIAAVLFLALSPLVYGKTFSPDRIDDVIVDLAVGSFFGMLLWYFTRKHIEYRLVALAVVVALYLGAHQDGWLQSWWYSSPAPWAFEPHQLSLLAVIIPGTIAGDLVLRWMRSDETPNAEAAWNGGRLVALTALCVAMTPIVVVGMYTRAVQATTDVVLVLLAVGVALTWNPRTPLDRLLRSLFLWGALWLTIGLLLEPSEGGIKKVPETLSYFFTVTGTTSLLLVAMSVLTESARARNWVHALIDVGQNPLLGYVLFTVLLNPLLELIPPMRGVLQSSPGESVLRSLIETVVVVLAVRFFTHKRIYWRA